LNSTLAANVATMTANNATNAFGKNENALNVNSAVTALTANNSTNAFGKTEGNLNVNNATTATTALTANNSTNLGGQAASFYAANSQLASYALLSGAAFTGAVSGITTLAAGNTTITGFANVSSTLRVDGIATFNANVGLSAADHLILSPTSAIVANGSFGSAGHVLHSNGSGAVYWAADDNTTYDLASVANTVANAGRLRLTDSALANDDVLFVGTGTTTVSSNATQITINSADQFTGTVTSVASGNGLTGGPITTTGTLSVVANSGLIANTTGVFVNANTELTANSSGVFHNDITRSNTTTGNTSPNYGGTFTAVDSITTNARGHVTAVNTKTVTMPSSNNTTYDLVSAANTVANEGLINLNGSDASSDTAKLIGLDEIVVSSNNLAVYVDHADVARSNATSVASPASGGTFTAIDSITTNARGHVTAINTKTVTLPVDPNTTYDLLAVANTVANQGTLRLKDSANANDDVTFTGSGTTTVSSNATHVIIGAADQFTGTVTSVATGNGLTGGTITGTGTVSVVANSGLIANTTGVFVNANTELTANSTGVFHNDIARSNNTSAASPASGGTFTAIDSITTNARGHVTAINTKTVTLPVDPDTNTTYDLLAVANTTASNAMIRLQNSSNSNDTIFFVGTGTTVTTSNATHVIINSADQYVGTVTSVGGGAGLTGTVTTSGSLAVGQGTGITVNADDIAVNASYIATISANNATYLNGQLAEYYTNATNISTGTLAEARLPYRMDQNLRTTDSPTFASGSYTGNLSISGSLTITGNLTSTNVSSLAVADPLIKLGVNNADDTLWGGFTFHYSGSGNTTNHAGLVRNPTSKEFILMSTFGDEVAVANNNTINIADASFSYANLQVNLLKAGNSTVFSTINATSFSGTANNATNFGGQAASFYTNATNITTGTLPYAQIPANIVNTTSNFTVAGAWTFNANTTWGAADHIILSSTSGISANGSYGTAGHTLHTNGSAVYWAADDNSGGTVTSIATANGLSGGTITTSGTLGVTTGSTLSVNTTGIHVNVGHQFAWTNTQTFAANVTWTGDANRPDIVVGPLAGVRVGNTSTPFATGGLLWFRSDTYDSRFNSGSLTIRSFPNSDYNGVELLDTGINVGNTTGAGKSSSIGANGISTSLLQIGSGSSFIANTTGAYHTGIINAASHTVGTSFIANSTGVTTTGFANVATTLAAGNTTITGFANASVSVNSALLTVGTSFIANTTGAYHTGTINAASFTTTNFRANTTGAYPLSNTAGNALGNTISRWALSATTGSFAGAVDGITTLAAGNTTITGFANASVSVNSALLTVGTSFIANTTGVTTTGFANVATTLQVGTNTATFGTATYMVSNGNLGVGTSTPGYKLEVNGSFAATTKSFLINHPTKEGMKLRYASLEGPENGVYVRGRLKDSNVIELPDYWTGLVDADTITVNLTAIGKSQDLWVEDIVDNTIVIGGENVNCFYTVFAERKDVEKLEVEF
jgi:hypothetical protein